MTNYESVINDLRWLDSVRSNLPEYKRRMCREAANAIEILLEERSARQAAEKNEPLTLDELRQMDGEPVWIVENPDWGHWELSADAEDYLEDREPAFYGMTHDDPAGSYGLHKLGWLAYSHKPKEAEHEKNDAAP